ncbi:hypothetical protein [Nevskia sp.]|uniref:hypothetical protein n=1 Tax=Nevskia sp. TaxID=1929292 RepID=UPI0025CF7A8B|nr:hypothetical protein [Nevskia sp.]
MSDAAIISGNLVIKREKRWASIELPYPVKQLLLMPEAYIVRFEAPPGRILNENVIALNESGEIIWTISTAKHVYPDSPCTNIYADSDSRFIWASNWDGAERKIDVATDQTVMTRYTR